MKYEEINAGDFVEINPDFAAGFDEGGIAVADLAGIFRVAGKKPANFLLVLSKVGTNTSSNDTFVIPYDQVQKLSGKRERLLKQAYGV